MTVIRYSLLALLLIASAIATFAQSEQASKPAASAEQTITISILAKGVRFTALGNIGQTRLEVFSPSGVSLYNSDFKAGNVQDWALQDNFGQPLPDGSYLCVVTTRNLSGKLGMKQGTVLVQGGQASLKLGENEQVGAVEADKALVPVPSGSTTAVTLLAHDGKDGQMVSTQGGLTFRAGDFFARQDKELMRLTAEGQLGLGVSNPQVKLDVAGPIRTSEGIVFPDGTVQTTAYVASGRSLSERTGLQRDAQSRALAEPGSKGGSEVALRSPTLNVNGAGSPGRLAKWTSGTDVGDSALLSESAGALILSGKLNSFYSVAAPVNDRAFFLQTNATGAGTGFLVNNDTWLNTTTSFSQPQLANFESTIRHGALAGGGAPGTLAQAINFIIDNQTFNGAVITNSYGLLINSLSGVNRWGIYDASGSNWYASGNIGIGTNSPQARLHVVGDIQVTGNAVINGNIAAKYQDVAEWVPTHQQLAAGTVVSLDEMLTNAVVASAHAYDTRVAGVISAQPGVILGEGGAGKVLVATTGRVKVKVDATRYPIKVGDLLVTSGKTGLAMKSQPVKVAGKRLHRPGTIVGKALEPLAKGQGEILVLLSLQ